MCQGRYGLVSVSILVFLEVSQRLELDPHIDESLMGFNPCFSGSESAAFMMPPCNGLFLCFNPCFSGSESAAMIGYDTH